MKKKISEIFNKNFVEGIIMFHLLLLPTGIVLSSYPYNNLRDIINCLYYLVVIGCAMAFFYNYDEAMAELRNLKSERK